MHKFEHTDDERWKQLLREIRSQDCSGAARRQLIRELKALYEWYCNNDASGCRHAFQQVIKAIRAGKPAGASRHYVLVRALGGRYSQLQASSRHPLGGRHQESIACNN